MFLCLIPLRLPLLLPLGWAPQKVNREGLLTAMTPAGHLSGCRGEERPGGNLDRHGSLSTQKL